MAGNIKPRKENKLKCAGCGAFYDRELLEVYEKKNYCSACLANLKRENDAYNKLIEYIEFLTGEPASDVSKRLVRNYHEYNNYTYQGMKATLQYYYKTLHNGFDDSSDFLRIIPYAYEECKNFHAENKRLKEEIEKLQDLDSQKINPIIINREDVEDYKEKRNREWKEKRNCYILNIDDVVPTSEELKKLEELGLLHE